MLTNLPSLARVPLTRDKAKTNQKTWPAQLQLPSGGNRVAGACDLPVYETTVGFKYIGESINENKIVIGGEESARLSIQGHHPEKDGILACLLAAQGVAARGASLTSGSEPVNRNYAESELAKDVEVLLEQGYRYILGG